MDAEDSIAMVKQRQQRLVSTALKTYLRAPGCRALCAPEAVVSGIGEVVGGPQVA